jgi:hypothetical protein
MKKILSLFVLSVLMLATVTLSAQTTPDKKTVTGSWLGKLSADGMELRVVFNLKIEQDSLICTLDSPDQGAADLPCGKVTLDKQKLVVLAPDINGEYTGTVTSDSTINGTWTQNGGSFTLDLKKKLVK